MRVVFQNPGNTTVMIKSTAWGQFGEPMLISVSWLEDQVIQSPVSHDLPPANSLQEQAGFTSSHTTVTLRNRPRPKRGNPQFIFGQAGEPNVFVDTVTGTVTTQT